MRILFSFVVVLATMATFTATSEAQYNNGYQFGAGVRANCGLFGRGFITPREQPPYFAQFPPVYYSHIVRRPYGISPYAAPAGIAPVEMTAPVPLTVKNPFFNEVAPVSNEDELKVEEGNKLTWRKNPYLENFAGNN